MSTNARPGQWIVTPHSHFVDVEGPGAMLGSAVIGGFILAMIEGTGILINRYSQMLMPQPGMEGMQLFVESSDEPIITSL